VNKENKDVYSVHFGKQYFLVKYLRRLHSEFKIKINNIVEWKLHILITNSTNALIFQCISGDIAQW
jgi:hypothetical protein